MGRSWAIAKRFVPLTNCRAEKTITIVFQICLKLEEKSFLKSPDRAKFELQNFNLLHDALHIHVWRFIVQSFCELVTIAWKRGPTQSLLGDFGELHRTGTEQFFGGG